jgi:hypothetical protein
MARRDTGKTTLDLILSKIPDEAKRKALLADLGTDDIYDVLGDGFLRQDEFSRNQNNLQALTDEINTKHAEMIAWFEGQKGFLEDYKTIKPEYEKLKKNPPTPGAAPDKPAAGAIPDEILAKLKEIDELKAALANATSAVPGFAASLVQVSERYFDDFKERLDHNKVLAHAQKLNTNVETAYNDLFKDKYAEREKKAHEEKEKAAEARGFERARRELAAGALPIGVSGASEPGTLDGLKKDPSKREHVAAAVQGYWEMQGKGAGA